MSKTSFKQVFDNLNVNLRKHEEFLTSIPCIPILKYGQSKAPYVRPLLLQPIKTELSRRQGKYNTFRGKKNMFLKINLLKELVKIEAAGFTYSCVFAAEVKVASSS